MGNHTRERVGLLIFFALVLLGGAVLISYFATGLTWTVYATSVDDRVGNMAGYTAVVYAGTVPEEDVQRDDERPMRDADDIPAIADTIGLRILSYYPKTALREPDGVYTSDVRELYVKKDASVITIDALDILEHPEPRVIEAGDRLIGVFGVRSYLTKAALSKITDELYDQGAEAIICVTMRTALLASYEGISVVLLTDASDDYPTTGYRENDTLVVQAPRTGEAGVVFFSNNNVASARSIDAL